ncbi:MAG: malate dehydrogenase [Campylobacterales bacterium]|nr:malate dehydrogenase [Campylobacterales bacterium]
MTNRRVGIIGAGAVGATTAYTLAILEVCQEIILYDIVPEVAIGKSMDIAQATNFSQKNTRIGFAAKPSEMRDCDIVIVTAGVPRKKDMTRADLLMINAKIVEGITRDIIEYSPNAVIICVSNPLDVMTYLMQRISGLDRKRVVGMAGALDGARMAYELNKITKMSLSQTRAMVIGEHGLNMIPYPTLSTIGGIPVELLVGANDLESIIENTRMGGAQIVKYLQTSAYYAPARSIVAMVDAMFNDAKAIISSSVVLEGEYGYSDTALGVPVVLGIDGVEEIIELDVSDSIKAKLDKAVASIQSNIAILKENAVL